MGRLETMDLAGGTALIIRRLIVPLAVAVVAVHAGQAFAQGAFPAPLARSGRVIGQRSGISAGERRSARAPPVGAAPRPVRFPVRPARLPSPVRAAAGASDPGGCRRRTA